MEVERNWEDGAAMEPAQTRSTPFEKSRFPPRMCQVRAVVPADDRGVTKYRGPFGSPCGLHLRMTIVGAIDRKKLFEYARQYPRSLPNALRVGLTSRRASGAGALCHLADSITLFISECSQGIGARSPVRGPITGGQRDNHQDQWKHNERRHVGRAHIVELAGNGFHKDERAQ
jgi:hypothetical protein